MCLRFAFLLIKRMVSWLRWSRRKEAWLTAEILILRRWPSCSGGSRAADTATRTCRISTSTASEGRLASVA
jgi:hypothetical protein